MMNNTTNECFFWFFSLLKTEWNRIELERERETKSWLVCGQCNISPAVALHLNCDDDHDDDDVEWWIIIRQREKKMK